VSASPGIRARLEAVRSRIQRACERAGRPTDSVILVGASKTVPVETLREFVTLGLTDLGENRVQEAAPKVAALGDAEIRWHMIGHLQRNKTGRAVELFGRVHGVDDHDLASALSTRAIAAGRVLPVLVEVNVSGEATKHGIEPDRLEDLIARMRSLPGLAVDGLMTVGRPVERAEDARGDFVRLRTLRDRVAAATGLALPELSMGMSADFEVAIQEGATFVRVGTALFGARALPNVV
jgi:PLP dependent protein